MDPPIYVLHEPLQTIINIHFAFVIKFRFIGRHQLQHHRHDLHFVTRYVFYKKWHLQIMFEISLFLDVDGEVPCLHLTSNNLCNLKQNMVLKSHV
jgi:hypothetical protein